MSYPIRRLSRTPEGNSATQSLVTNCSGSGENCSGIHHLDLEALDTAVGTPSFLIILVSNGIVIYLVSKSWTSRRRQSVPNLLVLALAATDFLTGLMGYPPRLLSFYSGQWLGGKMMCHFTSFIFSFFLTTSQCIVVLMGVERYLSMEKPFFYQNYCTVNRCAALLVVVWLYSTMVAGAGIAMEEVHDNSGQADRAKKYGCYNLPCTQLGPYRTTNAKIFALWTLIQGLFFICVLLISNVVVIKAIKVLEEKAATCCPRSKEEYMRQMDMIKGIHREFSRLMQVINVVFSLCLLPTLIRIFCNLLPVLVSIEADYFAWRLLLTNSLINPLIYGLLRRGVRLKFQRWLITACECCRPNKVTHVNDDIEDDNLNTYTPTIT